MKLKKGKDIIELSNPIKIRAYKNVGYEEVEAKPKKVDTIRGKEYAEQS